MIYLDWLKSFSPESTALNGSESGGGLLSPLGSTQPGASTTASAEEVAAVDPNLAACDKNGQIETVRYTAVNAMLLNEFLKEHRTVQEQGETITRQRKDFEAIAQQQKQIETLTATVKEQASQIQKVNAQLELRKPSSQAIVSW